MMCGRPLPVRLAIGNAAANQHGPFAQQEPWHLIGVADPLDRTRVVEGDQVIAVAVDGEDGGRATAIEVGRREFRPWRHQSGARREQFMAVVAADRFDLAGQLVRRAFHRDDDVGNVLVVDTSIVVVVGQVDDDRRRVRLRGR